MVQFQNHNILVSQKTARYQTEFENTEDDVKAHVLLDNAPAHPETGK